MFLSRPSDVMLKRTSDIVEGVFSPIPTLRTLALQSLVLSNWPTEEFVPGEGYSNQAKSLRLLTNECVGGYQMTGMEESLVYGDGIEGTDEERETFRGDDLNTGVVHVAKPSSGEWIIGDLISFTPGGCLRHKFRDEENTDVWEITDQEWIESSSLVCHRFSEWQYTDEEDITDCDDTSKDEVTSSGEATPARKHEFGVDFRVAVTFYQDIFIYKERVVNTRRCTACHNCSYTYSITAWFMKK